VAARKGVGGREQGGGEEEEEEEEEGPIEEGKKGG